MAACITRNRIGNCHQRKVRTINLAPILYQAEHPYLKKAIALVDVYFIFCIMETQFRYNGRLWLEDNGQPVLGPGRIELIEHVAEIGSIRQAAIKMKMSYKQAWDMIDHMNKCFDKPLVISYRGGKGGGKAEVTEYGRKITEQFKTFYKEFHDFIEQRKFNREA